MHQDLGALRTKVSLRSGARTPCVDHRKKVVDIHLVVVVDIGWATHAWTPRVDHRKKIVEIQLVVVGEIRRACRRRGRR